MIFVGFFLLLLGVLVVLVIKKTTTQFSVGDQASFYNRLGVPLQGRVTEVFGPSSHDLIRIECSNGSFFYVRQSDARKL